MRPEQFQSFLIDLHMRLKALSDTKGREYSGGQDQFGNFDRLSQALGLPREAILLVYLTKHMDSIQGYVRGLTQGTPTVLSEPIEGRIDDAILYLVLLRAMVQQNAIPCPLSDPGPGHAAGPGGGPLAEGGESDL